MKTALCCIGKNENCYIREFVEWYKSIGITHIFLYDNNDDDGELFTDVINDYISNNYVEIINYRGKKICQIEAYTECYHNNKNDYDWIMFFDCDEFLQLNNFKTISDYLSNSIFTNFDMIHVNWMVYGDNDCITYEDKPLQE